MKNFTFYNGLLLMMLYFDITNAVPIPWWWPAAFVGGYMVVSVIETILKALDIESRIRFWFWKKALKYRVMKARDKAMEQFRKEQGEKAKKP